jgi:hypothetical protein
MKANREDCIWAAGVFESEGCTAAYMTKSGGLSLRLIVSQRELSPLLEFQRLFGGSIISRPNGTSEWRLYGRASFPVARALIPFTRRTPTRNQLKWYSRLEGARTRTARVELVSAIKAEKKREFIRVATVA